MTVFTEETACESLYKLSEDDILIEYGVNTRDTAFELLKNKNQNSAGELDFDS